MVIWEVGDDEKKIEGLDEFGNPDPAYAAALGLVRAPMGRRALAATIDIVIYLILQLPYWLFALPLILKLYLGRISMYGFVNHPQFILAVVMFGITFVLTLAYCIVQLVLHGRKGVTVGKGLMGIRSVNVKTLERPGFWRIVLRAVVFWGSGVVVIGPVLFCLSPLFDPTKRGRGWHDLVGRNWYVDVRNGLQPYDEKRMRIARKMVTVEPVSAQKPMPSLATPTVQGAEGEYRPGGRVSAGVLGVARPHGAGPRPEVGLSGLAEQAEPPAPAEPSPGRPVVGGYRRPAKSSGDETGQQPSSGRGSGATDLSSGSATPPAQGPPPAPVYSPPAPPAPRAPVSSGSSGGMVTGTPWGPPRAQEPAPETPSAAAEPDRSAAGRPAGAPQAGAPPAGAPPGAPLAVSSGAAAVPPPTPRPAQPGPPAVAQPDVEQTRMHVPSFVLHLDDGTLIPVAEAVVLGRDPAPGNGATHVIAVSDQTRSVSKTHLVLNPTEAGIEVTDLRSTNGTAVVHDGGERTLEPGLPILALPGDTVRFGERTAVVGHS